MNKRVLLAFGAAAVVGLGYLTFRADFFSDTFNKVKKTAKKGANAVASPFKKTGKSIGSASSSAFNTLKSTAEKTINKLKSELRSVKAKLNNVTNFAKDVVNQSKNVIGQIKDTVKVVKKNLPVITKAIKEVEKRYKKKAQETEELAGIAVKKYIETVSKGLDAVPNIMNISASFGRLSQETSRLVDTISDKLINLFDRNAARDGVQVANTLQNVGAKVFSLRTDINRQLVPGLQELLVFVTDGFETIKVLESKVKEVSGIDTQGAVSEVGKLLK